MNIRAIKVDDFVVMTGKVGLDSLLSHTDCRLCDHEPRKVIYINYDTDIVVLEDSNQERTTHWWRHLGKYMSLVGQSIPHDIDNIVLVIEKEVTLTIPEEV